MSETRKHWLSSHTISLTHLLTTVGIAAGAFTYATTQHERLTLVEERTVMNTHRIEREINRTAQDLALIRASQQRMEDRLDRFIERVE